MSSILLFLLALLLFIRVMPVINIFEIRMLVSERFRGHEKVDEDHRTGIVDSVEHGFDVHLENNNNDDQ